MRSLARLLTLPPARQGRQPLRLITPLGLQSSCSTSTMKRKQPPTKSDSASKKSRPTVPEYHATPSLKEEDGSIQWPAPSSQIEAARRFILDCAKAQATTLIVPDKDADGLSSGAILQHTLLLLGLDSDLIKVHLLTKGNTVHSSTEREKMASYKPSYIFVLDQGSRPGPPLIDAEHKAIIIDHHHATESDFPDNTIHVTACNSPPVATSSLLTYHLCESLHPEVQAKTDWLCVVGTHGDLGNTLKWSPPFPDMTSCLKKYTKKVLNDVVSAVNAPRRTATYDVLSAWTALSSTSDPATVLQNPRLREARHEVNAEVERCTHTAPKFSADAKVAVFRISSACQVHPVIATRWAGHLSSKSLEMVMVANSGYLDGKVNFSCRVARCARAREGAEVDIIAKLKGYASLEDPDADVEAPGEDGEADEGQAKLPLLQRLGEDFARGHVQASGGIVGVEEFEELMRRMRVGEKVARKEGDGGSPAKRKKGPSDLPVQKNSLMNYFGKQAAKT